MFSSRFNISLRRLVVTGSWVVVDQGLFSTTGFVSMFLLARWMSPAVFGLFSTLQSVSQLAAAPYFSLLIEPMSVLGPSVFATRGAAYERALRIAHAGLSVGFAFLVAPILWFTLSSSTADLSAIAVTFVLSLPLSFASTFVRRHCYNKRRIATAAWVSCVYFLTFLSSLFGLRLSGLLSSLTAWGANAVCGAIASCTILKSMGRESGPPEQDLPASSVIWEHWIFGRWDLIGATIFLAAQQLPVIAMTRWFGPGSAGALRALLLVTAPVLLLAASTSSAVLPVVAAAEARGDRRRAPSVAFMTSLGLTGVATVHLLVVYFLAGPLINLLYEGKYGEDAWLAPLLAFQVVVFIGGVGFDLHMRAARWPTYVGIYGPVVFIASAISTLFLVRSMGLVGTVYALVIMNIVGFITKVVIYTWWRQHREATSAPLPLLRGGEKS
jgi:O-antigen/teichoic acid export membrane protein